MMNRLTVGELESKLRKFPKGTEVMVGCGCCHHSSSGTEKILRIADCTDQTYGYIELILNDASQPEVSLSKDKEEFYKKEIEKLKSEKNELFKIILATRLTASDVKTSIEALLKDTYQLDEKGDFK